MNTTLCKRFIFLATVLLLGACKKDDKLAIPKELYVYAAPGIQAYNVLANGKTLLMRSTVLSQTNVGFTVLLSRPFEKNVEVTAVIDTAMVKVYDSLYNPSGVSPALPPGAFTLSGNGKVTINAGETSSEDSLRVTIADPSLLKTGMNNYVVPVVLQMAGNEVVPVSETRKLMFVVFEVTSIAKGITSLSNTNSEVVLFEDMNGVNTGPDMVYLKGVLNSMVGTETVIEVKENVSAIDAYNQKNGTSFIPFPSGSYQITPSMVSIAANQTEADDNIVIEITDKSAFERGKDYLLPIEVVDDNEPNTPPVDKEKKIVYIVLNVFVNNVDPSNSGLTGTKIDRTGWIATANNFYDDKTAPSKVLDGDNATAWDAQRPAWLQIDMTAVKVVKGFTFVPNYFYRNEDITGMDVYSSRDGVLWKLEGKYAGTDPDEGSSAVDPDIKTVRFVEPVSARYFKFEVTNGPVYFWTGMGELYGWE